MVRDREDYIYIHLIGYYCCFVHVVSSSNALIYSSAVSIFSPESLPCCLGLILDICLYIEWELAGYDNKCHRHS